MDGERARIQPAVLQQSMDSGPDAYAPSRNDRANYAVCSFAPVPMGHDTPVPPRPQ